MGNSCSSGQAHKDKDNASQHSEESPSYRITKPSIDASAEVEAMVEAAAAAVPDGTLLEPQASVRERRGVPAAAAAGAPRGPRVIGSSVSDSISLSSPVAAASPRELEPTLVPPSVAALPDELRAALLGGVRAGTSALSASDPAPPRFPARRNNAIIIYVCAADSQDCCSEKGALQCGAALRLRARARCRGWRLHVADLHWRSPLEQQRDHRFPVLCTTELARQAQLGAVVPVLFLNSGLGTPLLPHTLEAADFRAALDSAATDTDRALLNKWYSMDAAAEPPCYRLARGAPARWRREMARALAVLVRALPQEACDAYLTTVVEQEVHNTVLMSTEQARRCIWVCRSGAGAGAGVGAGTDTGAGADAGTDCAGSDSTEPGDAAGQHELQRRLTNLQRDLKQHLCERNIIRASLRGCGGGGGGAEGAEYTAGVRAALGERLDALVDALAAERDAPAGYQGVPSSLFEELTEQLTFCQQAAQSTSTREHTLNEIKAYVCGDSSAPLVLLGGAGSGKATLLARVLTLAATWQPDIAVLLRFVDLTAQSSSSHQLLKSLVDQLHVLYDGSIYRGRNNVASLTATLGRLLTLLGRCRPVLLALAGAGALRGARWLPATLPDNVKMILTLTEEADEPASSAVLAVVASEAGPRVLRAPPPSAEEARAVLAACAAHYPRTACAAPPSPRALARCTTPLYAKVVAWQCSLSTETFAEQNAEEAEAAAAGGVEAGAAGAAGTGDALAAGEELETQLAAVLAAAERALGAARVSSALALLCAARRGLDDTELLDLLAHDPLFRSEETYLPWAPASLFWPQLAALLGSFLRWDARGAARWRDAAMAAVARDRYLTDCERQVRERLVDYYEGVWYEENDPKMAGRLISQENKFSEDCYNTRKLDELPYQHYHLSRHDPGGFAHRPYFTDASWIYDKIAATDCSAFLADLELVALRPPPEHVLVLRDLLETHSAALDYDVRQFYGLLRLTLERRTRDCSAALQSDVCKRWLQLAEKPPIPTLLGGGAGGASCAETQARDELDASAADGDGFVAKSYELVVRLGGRHVAAVSAEREEICVWDVVACRKVRTLRGVTHPTDLVPVDRHKCVVLCRRVGTDHARVMSQGEFLVALKGVMNQKMPYYGLHDAHHLVALSRNRMYVNLMHMDTGDCVTTFKAGEDRFLNSLLVSGDGRILVCGDETQKPFPLLVWGLSSRKLLYDLRIPHHEFLTHLAAITHEGSYVCVVSRELDEPSPNFIVVYDLQSGTLFKKWKPGCDTAALAISSADSCVVSGLADARILVWDLLTGNCRLTLRGHVAAPSLLRLARAGGVLLSADSAARDRSVRLWDLTKGRPIAVYTPPERACACEVVTAGGGGGGGGTLAVAALALESRCELVPLWLEGVAPEVVVRAAAAAADDDSEAYGDPERDGAVFDLRDAATSS